MPARKRAIETVTLTPEMATALLEHNTLNRPLSDGHVRRIAGQIAADKWKFNGDTIKVSDDGAVLDGQHRLWAVIEAKKPVETIIVRGIARDAFATIDTVRRARSGGDVIALCGTVKNRNHVAMALSWLLRWQRGALDTYTLPQNKIENSDIEAAFAGHPAIVRAVDRMTGLRTLINVATGSFLYYVFTNRNAAIAERFVETLENPAGVGINDPFYRFRVYLAENRRQRREPLMTIALAFKAANAAKGDRKIQLLSWKSQGASPEAFPTLEI